MLKAALSNDVRHADVQHMHTDLKCTDWEKAECPRLASMEISHLSGSFRRREASGGLAIRKWPAQHKLALPLVQNAVQVHKGRHVSERHHEALL